MSSSSDSTDVQFLRRLEEVCTRYENSSPAERDIEQFCAEFSGNQRAMLLGELVNLDIELRAAAGEHRRRSDYSCLSELDQMELGAVPSGFLNGNLLQLAGEDDAAVPTSKRYRIGQSIGSGGIGEVWRVFDLTSERPLALKTLKRSFQREPAAIDRFLREAVLTGTLQHPGIPPVYDHGTLDDETPFFTMKLVEGQTLHQILRSRSETNKDLGHFIGIFTNIAQTLAYAHSQNVIHRDLKPHNIMVGQFGEVQVMDWGLAKRLDCDPYSAETESAYAADNVARTALTTPSYEPTLSNDDLTTAGDIVGTPGYMAPEQARGEIQTLDERVDVFGLGAILFQILLGRTLFQHGTRQEIIERTQRGDFSEPLAVLDQLGDEADLVSLCRRCLDPDPSQRPAHAGDVAQVTENYLSKLEQRMRRAEIERSESVVRMSETRIRQRWIIALTTALTAVAITAAIAIGIQWRRATNAAAIASTAQHHAEQETIATTEINEFLEQILSASLPERQGYDVSLKDALDATIPQLEGRFAGRPRVEGSIRRTLGESYRWLGELEFAEQQLRLALAAFEQSDNVDQMEIIETKDRLAGVLRSRGENEGVKEAESLRREVLRYCRSQLGRSHSRTVLALNNLGVVMLEQERPDEAYKLFAEALQIIDDSPDSERGSRVGLLQNIADIERLRGNFAAAEERFLDVINDPDASPGQRSNAQVMLGEMLHWEDRYDDSIRHLNDGLRVREEYYGPLHRLTLSAMRKLTRAMDSANRYDEQIELLTESIRRHTEVDWLAAGTVFEARSLMAKSLIGLGRHDEARQYIEATVDLARTERGADHKYTQQAAEQLKAFELKQAFEKKTN